MKHSLLLPAPFILGTISLMKKVLTLLLLLGLALGCITPNASAQADFGFGNEEDEEGPKVVNPYADKYKADITLSEEEQAGGIVPNFIYYTVLLRKPGASADDINLMITSPGAIVGCLDMEQPSIETQQSGNALHLKMTDGHIDVDTETIRYYHYECKPETSTSTLYLTLSKQQLQDSGIDRLVLFSEAIGPFNDMKLAYGEHSITITSEMRDLSRLGIPMSGSVDTLTYWAYPENTMALFSSGADLHDENTMANVRKLARAKGLTPLDEIYTDFRPHHSLADKLYVVDQKGIYKNKLENPDDVLTLGTIETTEVYFGPNGAYDKPIQKAVYAKTPGLYE